MLYKNRVPAHSIAKSFAFCSMVYAVTISYNAK